MDQASVISTLEVRFTETVNLLFDVLDSMPEDQVYFRLPVPDANSIPGLLMHVLGNIEQTILSTLAGGPDTRDREAELRTTDWTREQVHERWDTIRGKIGPALAGLPDGRLETVFSHPRLGDRTGFDLLLNVARHASEHLGEAQLIRDMRASGTLR